VSSRFGREETQGQGSNMSRMEGPFNGAVGVRFYAPLVIQVQGTAIGRHVIMTWPAESNPQISIFRAAMIFEPLLFLPSGDPSRSRLVTRMWDIGV
jgi:hypothetical protein